MTILQASILDSYTIEDLDNPDTTEILEMVFDLETSSAPFLRDQRTF